MNTLRQTPVRAAWLASLVVAGASGAVMAAETGRGAEDQARQDARRIEAESRRLQEQGRRQMQDSLRRQDDALQGQEDSIRRLEEARRRLEESSREVAQLSTQMGRDFSYAYSTAGAPPRAVLGVQLGTAGNPDGAVIVGVSPGGPAADAGIKEGDVISHVAGHDVSKDSSPQRAVIERMAQVTPETRVPITVLREGRKMNFEVTARAAPAPVTLFPLVGGPTQPLDLRSPADLERVRALQDVLRGAQSGATGVRADPIVDRRMFMLEDNRLGGMELATISDRLGSYFGVDSGVLVVRAGADAPFGLQDGDVILAIDGREPSNAQHVGRILRSYQPGETVKLRIQRDRRARDLEAALPGRGGN